MTPNERDAQQTNMKKYLSNQIVKMSTFPFTHFILLDFDTRRNWERLQNIIVVADQPWKIIVLYQTYPGGK